MASKAKKDFYSGIFFLLFSIFLYVLSYAIKMTKADSLGPQFFPRLVALFMAILSIVVIVNGYKGMKEEKNKEQSGSNQPSKAPEKIDKLSLLFSSILLIGYALLIDTLGFMITSALYLFFQIYLISPPELLKKKNLVINGVISIVVPVALYFIFYRAFNIFLPTGIFG